jgi:VWFA-related protein
MDHVFEIARKSNALIYWIRFAHSSGDPDADERVNLSSAWKNSDLYNEQRNILTRAVHQSGGRIFRVESPSKIRPVFNLVLEELRDQYVLGYYPDNKRNDGRWHRVKVRVEAADVHVRAPRGYVDH